MKRINRIRRSGIALGVVSAAGAATLLLLAGGRAAGAVSAPMPGARQYHASPSGTATGDGTPQRPLSLTQALSAQSPVLPGDVLWLHDGTYQGPFISELRGTETAPILVRQAAGERAVIDSRSTSIVEPALYVRGAWTTYWGFEVMSSDPLRTSPEIGSRPPSLKRGTGIDVHAPHTQFINLIVHDLANGIGLWSDAEGAEAYGNLVYFNGWSAGDRSHGHGIYTQNERGVRRVSDNIIFAQFSHGIHAYGSEAASLDHIELTGNIVFNNGALDRRYYDRNILLGGSRAATAPVLDSNYTYYTPLVRHGGENNIGYNGGCTSLTARNNYFAGQVQGGVPLRMGDNCTGTVTGNLFYGAIEPEIARRYPDNTYVAEPPRGLKVFVRPNRFEPGRGHIVIYNWDRLPEVRIDLSELGFDQSATFELRDAQDYFGPPIYQGVFGNGTVTLPMRVARVASPVGNVEAPRPTQPEFAVLIATGQPARDRVGGFAWDAIDGARRMWRQLWDR